MLRLRMPALRMAWAACLTWIEGVDAPDAAQQRVVGGLHARETPVHPGPVQGTQGLYVEAESGLASTVISASWLRR